MHGTLTKNGRVKRHRLMPRPWDDGDIDHYEQLCILHSRTDFLQFRRYINPRLKINWWVIEVCRELEQFYYDWKAGLRPKLVLSAPRQHGKSWTVIDFIAWVAGHDPDARTIFTSFSDRLGVRANLRLQRIFDNPKYKKVFPDTKINLSNTVTVAGRPLRNSSIIEYVGREGYFRNTTTGGPVTGESVDFGIVDDPLKGRAEANSPTIRDGVWDWFTDDFFGCFSEDSALLAIATRYHPDDPLGRMISTLPGVKVLRYPAIAEGKRTKNDRAYRGPGEPLFPELKSLEFLLERKRVLSAAGWESIWQQNPIVVGGGIFPVDKFVIVERRIDAKQIVSSIRYWDKAGTEGGGKYTAGVLMHLLKDGTFYISDVVRDQWNAWNREKMIKQATEQDDEQYDDYAVWVEQEPGSGGLESAQRTIALLRGYLAYKDKVSGSKIERADPYAAQVQAGNVLIKKARWNKAFLDEHEVFTEGAAYSDQVDAAAGAFSKLADYNNEYDSTYKWVG